MLKILFIGDISGKIGRKTIAKIIPDLKKKEKIDLVIANAENSAHGSGVTEKTLKELMDYGVDFMTTGDHAFKAGKKFDVYDKYPIIRPANFPPNNPGKGYRVIAVKNKNILIISLMGRVFMKNDLDCPFRKIDEILAHISLQANKLSAIIVDIHAEATSEKQALKYYLDGKISALLGTHTHVMTADSEITDKGTAYITDTGMTGYADGCLGVDKDGIIETFITQIKNTHIIHEKGRAMLNAVIILINEKTRKAVSIKPIIKHLNIK